MAGKKGAGSEIGFKAETFFLSLLNKHGIPYHYYDSWYDVEVVGQKVEIKSCRFSVKDKGEYYRPGRFDFTNKDNRELQYNHNVWIAFILRNNEDFLLLGMVRAKQLNKKRYIKSHLLRMYKIVKFDDWLDIIMKNKKKQNQKENQDG